MPLVLFPGGYGGMVHSDAGRVSFSCCIRRDALRARGAFARRLPAGEAVLAHAMRRCRGIAKRSAGRAATGPWLSAGPIRPGIRTRAADGIFAVGNAAGEAHPLIAEGISMAIQSAWLLASASAARKDFRDGALERTRREYAARWPLISPRACAPPRSSPRSARAPRARRASVQVLRSVPALLTLGRALERQGARARRPPRGA